ncbi:hypothetical protein EGW08_001249 [Elysia chlorotica]|uniref:Major facilitator superfamily (MFS) profile domain-containing protein n=1 Tax=Elysia chlorotica TaxID=188477 RepID=A0A3S1A010_ELYCH|nr:hypothetical protein EGW08_001249 [Elysia chlorotica]
MGMTIHREKDLYGSDDLGIKHALGGVNSDSDNDVETFNMYYFGDSESAQKQSLIRPTKKESSRIETDEDNLLEPEDYIPPLRSCIALCAAFIFTYSAFEAIQSLQSSLNAEGHLGEISLSIMYLCVLPGSFLAPVCARLVRHKGLLCLGFIGHVCYTCANFVPTWATLIPVSAAQGVLTGGLGMSQSVYVTAISTSYNHYKRFPKSRLYGTISFFNGIFFSCFKAAHISGNLLSSGILQSKAYNESILRDNKCGTKMCSNAEDTVEFDRPSRQIINILFGAFAACGIIGLAIIVFGLPSLKNITAPGGAKTGGCTSMMLNPKFILLAPSIMAQSIVLMATYTGYPKAFVSCAVGVQWVGFSMVSMGIVSTITSLVANYLVRYTGRILQFAVGMGIDIFTIVTMLLWQPDYTTSPMVLLILPALAGVAQGILQPQQQALIASVFPTEQHPSAFSAANGVKCLAFSIYLIVASTVCFYHGLILALGLYLPGLAGYAYTEIREKRQETK